MSTPRIGPDDLPDVRKPPERSPVPAVVLGVILGLLWQTMWAHFPDWQMPINGLALYLLYRLLKWAKG